MAQQRYANECDLLYLLRDEKAFEIGALRRQCEMTVTDSIRKPKAMFGIHSWGKNGRDKLTEFLIPKHIVQDWQL